MAIVSLRKPLQAGRAAQWSAHRLMARISSCPIRCTHSNSLALRRAQRVDAKIVGVTGSAGKTGTKEALFAALERCIPGKAHRSVKSYNNHVGVPLSLARMPRETEYGVFEMGMNHEGRTLGADHSSSVRMSPS
jgi:UDP-N-acetylmuramyl pentapeptide synthase